MNKNDSTPEEPTAEKPITIIAKDATTKDSNVIFSISMKTILPQFKDKEAVVSRSHADFVWLHRAISENPKYSGLIIPPCPPEADFSVDRDAISVYCEDENLDPEAAKITQAEMEREYLVIFKKSVAVHIAFLRRITHISLIRIDPNFVEFLTSQEMINSKISSATYVFDFLKSIKKSVGENFAFSLSSATEPDPFFEKESLYLATQSNILKNVVSCADSMTASHKRVANTMIKLSAYFAALSSVEYTKLARICSPIGTFLDKARKIESKISSDEDLKLSDSLRFDYWNTQAWRDLLNRRTRQCIAVDNSFKALTKARTKSQNVAIMDDQYQQNVKAFENISESAKIELTRETQERIHTLKSNLISYSELMAIHLTSLINETKHVICRIQAED